jgi:hypothetical protein
MGELKEESNWWSEKRKESIITEAVKFLQFIKEAQEPSYNEVDNLMNKIHKAIDTDKFSK